MDSAIATAFDQATKPTDTSDATTKPDEGTPASSPAADAGSASASSQPSDKPASATTTPEDDESLATATSFTLDQHKRILDNARKKEADKVTQALREQYGLSPEEFAPFKSHLAYIRQHGLAAYYHELGKQFPQQIAATPPAKAERPKPDLVAEDGTAAYSAGAIERLLAWQDQQLMEKWNAQLTPLQQTHQTVQEQAVWSQALHEAAQDLEDAKTWEGFAELKPKILAMMQADGRVTMESAYRRLFQSDYLPTLKQKIGQSKLDELKTRPNGNTVRPHAAPLPATPRKIRSLDEAIDQGLEKALASR